MLPNFFILGVQKSGTTALYEWIRHHHEIFLTSTKEPDFFLRETHLSRGASYYQETYFEDGATELAIGEASISYFVSEEAAERINLMCGNQVKFILVFRNPFERINSAYWHFVGRLKENIPLLVALETESFRIHKLKDEGQDWWRYAYLGHSCYATNLRKYLDIFPKENFLFLTNEDLRADPVMATKKVLEFLDVDTSEISKLPIGAKFNQSMRVRNPIFEKLMRNHVDKDGKVKKIARLIFSRKFRSGSIKAMRKLNAKKTENPPLPEEAYDLVAERLNQEILELEKLIDRDLSHWLWQKHRENSSPT